MWHRREFAESPSSWPTCLLRVRFDVSTVSDTASAEAPGAPGTKRRPGATILETGNRHPEALKMTTSDVNRPPNPDGPNSPAAVRPTPGGGDGPGTDKPPSHRAYHHPAAGWGAAKSVTGVLVREHALLDGARAIHKMNHENGGFDCPGCAWPDDIKGLRLPTCANGIKPLPSAITPTPLRAQLFPHPPSPE